MLYGWWPFNTCLLLGTILSATDPVAVVALLKELGAAKTLGTLIEGESLLNDGSAVVLFEFVYMWVKHDTGPPVTGSLPLELMRILAQMLFFGVLLGVAFGAAVEALQHSIATHGMTTHENEVNGACSRQALLRRVYNDVLVEVTLVVSSTYLTFWMGEQHST